MFGKMKEALASFGKACKKVFDWFMEKPLLRPVAFAAPIVFDILTGGCMFLGTFAAFAWWKWALLPVVWVAEGLITCFVSEWVFSSATHFFGKMAMVTGWLCFWVVFMAMPMSLAAPLLWMAVTFAAVQVVIYYYKVSNWADNLENKAGAWMDKLFGKKEEEAQEA